MSLESDVAAVLRNDPAGRITFKVENILVSKAQMEDVAKAIESKDVALETGSTGGQLGAAYSSFVSRRWTAGERKIIGKITLSGPDIVKAPLGRAAVFHESVHALVDVKGLTVTMHNDEVVAYIADAMYLRATKTSVSGGKAEMAIYTAAFSLVDTKQLLTKPGVTLSWADCDALRTAIKAHPAYGG